MASKLPHYTVEVERTLKVLVRGVHDHAPDCLMLKWNKDQSPWYITGDHCRADSLGRIGRGNMMEWKVVRCNDPGCPGKMLLSAGGLYDFLPDLPPLDATPARNIKGGGA